jgi:hypothetical protein
MGGLLDTQTLDDYNTWLDDILQGQAPGQAAPLYVLTHGTKIGPQGRPVPADIWVRIDDANWWGVAPGTGRLVFTVGGEQATATDRVAYPRGEQRVGLGSTVAQGGTLHADGSLTGGYRYHVLAIDTAAVKWVADLQIISGQEQHG